MKRLLLLCVLVPGLGAGQAHAASLQVDEAGLLTGATGGLLNGCAAAAFNVCIVLTPYGFSSGTPLAGLTNYGEATGQTDVASSGSMVADGTATSGIQTFADWSLSKVTEVPEPSTFGLLCAGLIAMALPLARRVERITRAR